MRLVVNFWHLDLWELFVNEVFNYIPTPPHGLNPDRHIMTLCMKDREECRKYWNEILRRMAIAQIKVTGHDVTEEQIRFYIAIYVTSGTAAFADWQKSKNEQGEIVYRLDISQTHFINRRVFFNTCNYLVISYEGRRYHCYFLQNEIVNGKEITRRHPCYLHLADDFYSLVEAEAFAEMSGILPFGPPQNIPQ